MTGAPNFTFSACAFEGDAATIRLEAWAQAGGPPAGAITPEQRAMFRAIGKVLQAGAALQNAPHVRLHSPPMADDLLLVGKATLADGCRELLALLPPA